MQRLTEDGWLVAAHAGRFDLRAIGATSARRSWSPRGPSSRSAEALLLLARSGRPARHQLVGQALPEEHVLLVLDDFEQNLHLGGGEFLDPDVAPTCGGSRNARGGGCC